MSLKCISSSPLWRVSSPAANLAESGSQEERDKDSETNLVDIQVEANAVFLFCFVCLNFIFTDLQILIYKRKTPR